MDASLPKPAAAASLLLQGPLSLAAWYADPLAQGMAEGLQAGAEQALQARLRAGAASCFQLQVLQLVCHFWLAESISLEYERLRISAASGCEQALLELVYGQLLVSCKDRPAHRHLESGFALAAPQLDAADYFRLLRRHELLGYLHLSGTATRPQALDALLAEAAVIRRLQQGTGTQYRGTHADTVG
jgi:hypothetical protein